MLDEDVHEGLPIYGLAMRPDGKGFCSGAGDKYVKFWEFNMVGNTLQASLTRQLLMTSDILTLSYSYNKGQNSDHLMLAVGLLDGTVKILYDDSLKFFLSLYGHKLPGMMLI